MAQAFLLNSCFPSSLQHESRMHGPSLSGNAAPWRHFTLLLLQFCLVLCLAHLTIPIRGRAPASGARIPGFFGDRKDENKVMAEQRWSPPSDYVARAKPGKIMHLQNASMRKTDNVNHSAPQSLTESFFQYYVRPESPHQTALKWLGISFSVLMGIGLLAAILSCLFSSSPYAKEKQAYYH